jgi:hypothetical protein
MTRRLALALALVSACLVDVAASSWSSCGRSSRCAESADATKEGFLADPSSPFFRS